VSNRIAEQGSEFFQAMHVSSGLNNGQVASVVGIHEENDTARIMRRGVGLRDP
jgi:hypothetical protein